MSAPGGLARVAFTEFQLDGRSHVPGKLKSVCCSPGPGPVVRLDILPEESCGVVYVPCSLDQGGCAGAFNTKVIQIQARRASHDPQQL